MDFISGNVPDVISGLDYEDYMNYCNKSAFEELTPYFDDEIEKILDYICSCDTIGVMPDDDIGAILDEESGMFFAGEQTAEAAAEHIQDRLSILLSEKS